MKDTPPLSNAPLVHVGNKIEPWKQPEWQQFWLTIRAKPWNSLAVVPAASGAPQDFALNIAVSLARTGMVHLGVPIRVADATSVPLDQMVQLSEEVKLSVAAGDLVILALGTIVESPVAVSLAQSVDYSLLCVLFEKMASAEAKKTVNLIGTQKFIGSAVFHLTAER
jgi:hypothetical protein